MRTRTRRPSASMIVSLIALSVALAGTGYAASKINGNNIKNKSIAGKKLKNKAVETKKIDKRAITGGKIEKEAVTGAKIKASSTPFSRIVQMASGDSSLALGDDFVVYPLDDSTYTQGADEVNSFAGAMDVRFAAGCTQPRRATAVLLLDAADPLDPTIEDVVAGGVVEDEGAGEVTKRVNLGTFQGFGGPRFQPGADQSHTLQLIASRECNAGDGVTATFGGADVIATK